MKKVYSYLILICLLLTSSAQSDSVVGKNFQIQSEALDENRSINVYLPDGYDESSNEGYSVLYVLDGQRLFLHAVSVKQSFTQFRLSPEFIIVGIDNKYPDRFRNFTQRREQFRRFITNELIPFIDNEFNTSKNRMLFGWEYAGSFTLHTLINAPTFFKSYLLASPYPIENQLNDFVSLLSIEDQDIKLFYTVSPNEHAVNIGTQKLTELLENNVGSIDWTFTELVNEQHRTTAYHTLFHGLANHFKYFPELQIDDLDAFDNNGGVDYIKKYYTIRNLQYGFEAEPTTWTKYTALRSALRSDSYERFVELATQLKLDEFFLDLNPYRILELAGYFEANSDFNKAEELYEMGLSKYQDNEQIKSRLQQLRNKKD